MNKTIGKDIDNPIQREQFIKDNADKVENKGYMKPYTPEELQGHKEMLANVSIEIAEIEAEMKQVQAEYKGRLKPLKEARANMVSNIKAKAEYVTESFHRPRRKTNVLLQRQRRFGGIAPGNRRRIATDPFHDPEFYQ